MVDAYTKLEYAFFEVSSKYNESRQSSANEPPTSLDCMQERAIFSIAAAYETALELLRGQLELSI
jgi:hypothetical protein